MDEKTVQIFSKELRMDSGEAVKISVELVNVKQNGIVKDFLETMLKEIEELL